MENVGYCILMCYIQIIPILELPFRSILEISDAYFDDPWRALEVGHPTSLDHD